MKITRDKNIVTIEIEDSDVEVDPGENLQTEKEIFADSMCVGMRMMIERIAEHGLGKVINSAPIEMISEEEAQTAARDINKRWEILPNHG